MITPSTVINARLSIELPPETREVLFPEFEDSDTLNEDGEPTNSISAVCLMALLKEIGIPAVELEASEQLPTWEHYISEISVPIMGGEARFLVDTHGEVDCVGALVIVGDTAYSLTAECQAPGTKEELFELLDSFNNKRQELANTIAANSR